MLTGGATFRLDSRLGSRLGPRPGRPARAGVPLALVTAFLLAACGGASPTGSDAAASRLANPSEFAAVVAAPATFVLNVHTPDEGSITGTDAAIPFDQLRDRAAQLPSDRATPIAVYCRTGRMSAEAVGTLADLGFTDITELDGGMDAWQQAGRRLLPPGTG